MADLPLDDVRALAVLARLELDDAEVAGLARDLGGILEAMARLAAVDTAGVEPMTHAVPMALALRADDVAPSLAPEVALAGAPDVADDCFRVPAAIKAER